MNKIKITIGGAGYEIVQSTFKDDELTQLETWCQENEESMEGAFLFELEEILDGRGPWYECDDLGHYYGASLSSRIYLEDNEGEWELDVSDVEHDVAEVNETSPSGTTICCVSWEKGTILDGEFELEDGEKFDEKKLKLEVKELMTPSSIYEIITGFSYDGKEILNDGPGDTTGKGFDVEID